MDSLDFIAAHFRRLVPGLRSLQNSCIRSYVHLIGELATAGFLSAVPGALVAAPIERAKVLLQVQGQHGEKKYKGVVDVLKVLYKEEVSLEGSVLLWHETVPEAPRYEVAKRALIPAGSDPSQLNLGAIIVAGGTAGISMWSIAISPDVLKSRIQSAPAGTFWLPRLCTENHSNSRNNLGSFKLGF